MMEVMTYVVYGVLMAVLGFLLWLMLKDAKSVKKHDGWGGGHGVNINHKLSHKDN